MSQGSHCAAQIAACCGHAVLAASRLVDRNAFPQALSRSIGGTISASYSCAQPQVCGFNAFEEPVDVLLNDTASVNFIRTSARAMGRGFRGQGCGNCCPGSDFFGPQSSGAIVAAVHSFAVWCGTIARVQVPIHSSDTAGPPTAATWHGRQHNPSWPSVSPTSLVGA